MMEEQKMFDKDDFKKCCVEIAKLPLHLILCVIFIPLYWIDHLMMELAMSKKPKPKPKPKPAPRPY